MNIDQPTSICFFRNNQTVGRNKAFLVFGILSRKCDILLLISGTFLYFLCRQRRKPIGIFIVVFMANATHKDVYRFSLVPKNTWQCCNLAISMKKSTKHHKTSPTSNMLYALGHCLNNCNNGFSTYKLFFANPGSAAWQSQNREKQHDFLYMTLTVNNEGYE